MKRPIYVKSDSLRKGFSMLKKHNPTFMKAIPIAGWIFVIVGFIYHFENVVIYIGWLIVLFLCAGLHTIQLLFSIPLGKKKGFGYPEIIFKTLLFGVTWWGLLKE